LAAVDGRSREGFKREEKNDDSEGENQERQNVLGARQLGTSNEFQIDTGTEKRDTTSD